MQTKYDYLIVGSGLFGSTCAFLLKNKGYKVLVIDKRNHIGGNIYTELKDKRCLELHILSSYLRYLRSKDH